jgi:threonine/homoserine/homoserine lactone efflux protein
MPSEFRRGIKFGLGVGLGLIILLLAIVIIVGALSAGTMR